MEIQLLVVGLCCFGLGVFVGAVITHTASEKLLREYERAFRVMLSKCSNLKDDRRVS